nr:MAG: hypothetical protein [Jiangsu picobirnavirus 87]
MTRNQIAWAENLERARSNRANELETNRANIAREQIDRERYGNEYKESVRHNRALEGISENERLDKQRYQQGDLEWKRQSLDETRRANSLLHEQHLNQLREQVRSNRAQEVIKRTELAREHMRKLMDIDSRHKDRLAQLQMSNQRWRESRLDRSLKNVIESDRNSINRERNLIDRDLGSRNIAQRDTASKRQLWTNLANIGVTAGSALLNFFGGSKVKSATRAIEFMAK